MVPSPRCTIVSAMSAESRPGRCAVASRALTRRPWPEGWQLSREQGREQGTRWRARREARNPQVTYRFVHGFVHETWRDAPRRGRRGGLTGTLADRSARSARSLETARDDRDARRMAHNPEVEGSNPSPATKFAGQRPLPIMEGAFCVCRVHGIVHEASEEGRRGGWAVRRTPRTSFATQAADGLPLRCCAR